jgi:hypothetical protein
MRFLFLTLLIIASFTVESQIVFGVEQFWLKGRSSETEKSFGPKDAFNDSDQYMRFQLRLTKYHWQIATRVDLDIGLRAQQYALGINRLFLNDGFSVGFRVFRRVLYLKSNNFSFTTDYLHLYKTGVHLNYKNKFKRLVYSLSLNYDTGRSNEQFYNAIIQEESNKRTLITRRFQLKNLNTIEAIPELGLQVLKIGKKHVSLRYQVVFRNDFFDFDTSLTEFEWTSANMIFDETYSINQKIFQMEHHVGVYFE